MHTNRFSSQLAPKILEFMNLRIKEFDTNFYKKCILGLKSNNNNDEYYYEPLRLFLIDNFDEYYYYLSDHLIDDNTIQRELTITDHAKTNLLRQFNAIELNNINALLTNTYPDFKKIIFVVSPTELSDNNIIRIRSKDSLGLFLGQEVLRIAEHQDMERLVGFMINKRQKRDIRESTQMFREMYGMYKSLDQNTKDRSLFFSGFCLHALGTTYTEDADMIYWAKNDNSNIKKAEKIFSKHHKLEYFIHTEKRNDIDVTGEVLTDPTKHFYFMGMKIVGINIHLQRLYFRASPAAFVDMYMLNKINKFNIKPCFPLMTLRDDPPIIFTKSIIKKKLRTVKKYLKEWHGINVSNNETRMLIKRCKNYPNDPPFSKQFSYDKNIMFIETNQQTAILLLMEEYFHEREKILIIENRVSHKHNYEDKIKNIVIKKDFSTSWSNDKKNRNILIHNSDEVLKNKNDVVNNITLVDDPETVIIITYLDGTLIKKKMDGTNMYQIKDDENVLLFGIYEYAKNEVVVFMKDSEDYCSGNIEKIITLEEIKEIFNLMSYTMIQENALNAVTNDNKMNELQINISDFFSYAVFKKNKNESK